MKKSSRDDSLKLAPASLHDYRELAKRKLPRQLFDYIDGGASKELTLRANVSDYQLIYLRQRVMRDVSTRLLTTTVLGNEIGLPVILAPVAFGGMLAKRGEVQAARAAAKFGVPFCESTASICAIEEVASKTDCSLWYQLYVMRDREYSEDLMRRAESAGCEALVLTVDRAEVGVRYRDIRNGQVGVLSKKQTLLRRMDYARHPSWVRDVAIGGRPLTYGNLEKAVPRASTPSAFRKWVNSQFDPSVTWDELSWVRTNWKGKLVLKGILDVDDARSAIDHGADAIIVSNHGGRQLDNGVSTIATLPKIVDAVGGRIEILVDGGIRNGLDVVKALALGAQACLIGRPWAFGLAARGERGVEEVLDILRREIDVGLALTGFTNVKDLNRSALVHEGPAG